MKKNLLLVCLLGLFGLFQASAQTSFINKDDGEGAKVNIGLTFAPTIDWMFPGNEGYTRSGLASNFRTGLDLNVNLTARKNFYFTTGVSYEQLGGKLSFRDKVDIPGITVTESTNIIRTYRAQYITIPTAITLKTGSIHDFYICGNVGLYNSLLLKAYNIDGYYFTPDGAEESELWTREKTASAEAATFKESAFAGLGLEYSVTRNFRAGLYINYAYTFTNYFKGRGAAQNSLTHENLKSNLGYLEIALKINFF
ncbi:MAG: PorT family protein [Bacteroidales bacterium]|nr:PorT family protein [Bacteroidales bacterium]